MKSYLVVIGILFLLFSFSTPVFAQENSDSATQSAEEQDVNYFLPYPGLLPDNPLYILKAFRDRLVAKLISDPLKKAEFNLLTSDKRIYAGQFLIEKNKDELALTTISKGNNYFHEAISAAHNAYKAGKDVGGVVGNLRLSALKHEEVLEDLEPSVDPEYKETLHAEIRRTQQHQKMVETIIPQKKK